VRGKCSRAWLGRPLDAVRAMASCTNGLGLVFSSGGSGVLRRGACCCRASRGLSAGIVPPDSDAGGDPTGVLPPDECPCNELAGDCAVMLVLSTANVCHGRHIERPIHSQMHQVSLTPDRRFYSTQKPRAPRGEPAGVAARRPAHSC